MQQCHDSAAFAFQNNIDDAQMWFNQADWQGDLYYSDVFDAAYPVSELCDQNSPVHDYNACMEYQGQVAGEDENTTGDQDTGDDAGTGTEIGDDPDDGDWDGQGTVSP
jgi:hypothetical protein